MLLHIAYLVEHIEALHGALGIDSSEISESRLDGEVLVVVCLVDEERPYFQIVERDVSC